MRKRRKAKMQDKKKLAPKEPSTRVHKTFFTEDMKKDYTILVPDMLPIHFKLIINI